MAAGFTMEMGNCPPGYSRPAPMYDCRPNVSGQYYQQQDLQRQAAQYVDDRPYEGGTGATTGTPPLSFYQQQPPAGVPQYLPAAASSGGGDNTMLFLLAGLALFVLMKK